MKRVLIISFTVLVICFAAFGGTYAFLSWRSGNNANENTIVNFTATAEFSCSADGGGTISNNDLELAPASCTNSTHAIKRAVTVNPVLNNNLNTVYLNLWLNVNSISSGLSGTSNFKYALTTGSSSCTDGQLVTGNFSGATTNTQKTLLNQKAYTQTTSDPYYLWIWLDAAETSASTQNQSFNFSLGGSCSY